MGDNGGFAAGGIESMGIMQALRTGNMIVDMMIAMLIPVLFPLIIQGTASLYASYKQGELQLNWASLRGKLCERLIEHKSTTDMWGDTNTNDRDTRNNVLIKAIQLYLDNQNVVFLRSKVTLTSMTQSERPWYYFDNEGGENTPAGKLKKYRLAQKSPNHLWQPIGIHGGTINETDKPSGKDKGPPANIAPGSPALVELRVEENEEDKGAGAEKTINTLAYRLRSVSAHAIDSFINDAYQWYLAELRKMEDNARYLYEMQVSGGSKSEEGKSEGGKSYKRYKLSDHKTFESLFFEEKATLLAILKHFQNKTGKYAIPGYPHKLGLLLHGPPGTGKTSLIKAMAQYTARSIVNVPLARITTNQELMDIMFDQQYMVRGEDMPIKLGFKDTIFVMEDVDAASKIVHRRDGKTTQSVTVSHDLEAPKPKSAWQLLLECGEENCVTVVKMLMEKSPRLKEAALSSSGLCRCAKNIMGPPGMGLLVGPESTFEGPHKEVMNKISDETKTKLEALNGKFEIASTFLNKQAAVLKRLLDAGGAIEKALEDELLGLTLAPPTAEPASLVRAASAGYSGATSARPDDDDDDDKDDGKPDADLMMTMMASLMDGGGSGGGGSGAAANSAGGAFAGPSAFGSTVKDKMNLSGLLNVLDGVVDTPERILIMTTNHPEQLDPALIRPGRIDKKILLGYMGHTFVSQMICHYFLCQLDDVQRERVRLSITGSDERPALNMTPAQIEQLAAEHDHVDNMLKALEDKVMVYKAPERQAEEDLPLGPPLMMVRSTSATVAYDQ